MEDAVVQTNFEGLSICPCNIDLAGAEVELISLEKREFQFLKILSGVKSKYDYIIVDCPPSLSLITVNILSGCDSVLIPLQCEYFALEGLSQLMSTFKKIKSSYNSNLEIEGVLLTMYDGRTNLTLQVASEIKKYFEQKVYKTPIPRSVRLGEAPSYGEPILYYDKHSKCTAAYLEVAKEIIASNQ